MSGSDGVSLVSPGRTESHNWLRVWADTGSGSERLSCVMLWCQAWAQHGAIAPSPPQPRNTRKITQYSPVSVPDRPLPATWSALKYYTGVLYFSFTYSKRPDSIKEKGFEAQKLNSNATFSRNLFFFLVQILTTENVQMFFASSCLPEWEPRLTVSRT